MTSLSLLLGDLSMGISASSALEATALWTRSLSSPDEETEACGVRRENIHNQADANYNQGFAPPARPYLKSAPMQRPL